MGSTQDSAHTGITQGLGHRGAAWGSAQPGFSTQGYCSGLSTHRHHLGLSIHGHQSGLSTHGHHSGFRTYGYCLGLSTIRAQHTWVLLRAQHTWASLGAIPAGCAKLLGSGPAPGSLCLFPEVLLAFRLCQVLVLAHMALSASALPLLPVCSLPWDKTPSQTCSPRSLCSALTLAWAEAMVSCPLCIHVPTEQGHKTPAYRAKRRRDIFPVANKHVCTEPLQAAQRAALHLPVALKVFITKVLSTSISRSKAKAPSCCPIDEHRGETRSSQHLSSPPESLWYSSPGTPSAEPAVVFALLSIL